MENILRFLRRYPFQIKISLFILDIIFVIVAVRIYVNYVGIETTIEDVHMQYENETQKVDFYKNFFLNYEQSEYSKYFLQHENNMLNNSEFVIKFENMPDKELKDWISSDEEKDKNVIEWPRESWGRFFSEKLSWK